MNKYAYYCEYNKYIYYSHRLKFSIKSESS